MQKAVALLFPILLLIAATGAAPAQYVFRSPTPTPRPSPSPSPSPTPGPAACPAVTVQVSPGGQVRDGQRIMFTANINGGDTKVVPTILWSTSAGVITQGNNTRRIEVDSTGAGSTPDREIRAEIWVGGYAPECVLQAAGTAKIIGPATKFGDFGVVDDATLKTNLEALAAFVAQSSDNVYLIAYAGRNSERGFTYNWLRRIKEGLVVAGVAPRRVLAMDGGFREEPLFDFWIVPVGAELPRPQPTVRRDEIVYPRTTAPPRKP